MILRISSKRAVHNAQLDHGRFSTSCLTMRANREHPRGAQWEYPVYASDRATERRSIFLAHASTLPTSAALPHFLNHLTTLPALKRATHCMYAWRVTSDPTNPFGNLSGRNDGGEKGSGERLSRLLEALDCENVVVVVSRWYGGIKLGSHRWKMISNVAKEAINRGNFGREKVVGITMSSKLKAKKKKE